MNVLKLRLGLINHQFSRAQTVFRSFSTETVSKLRVNTFKAGVFMNPHPEKRHKGGEDAACVTDNVLSVADGVGGWAENGIDPALYSRRLCKTIHSLALKDDDAYLKNPKRFIIEAGADNNETGSSTCVVASLDKYKNHIYTANLGDSGFLLLRKQGFDLVSLFRSKEQTHSFNFPFQIGTGGDDPNKAEEQLHEVQDKDILVLASDGLFDNLFDVKIIELIRPFLRDREDILDPSLVAEIIAKEAERYSNMPHYVSPFAKGARAHFYEYVGGKPDDISVIVAQVCLADQREEGTRPLEGNTINTN